MNYSVTEVVRYATCQASSMAMKVAYEAPSQVLLGHRKLMHYSCFLSFCHRSEVELTQIKSAKTTA